MAQSATAWREEIPASLGRASLGLREASWAVCRASEARHDGTDLLGVISEAAQQVRVQTARADAAEARFAEADARHRRTEDEARNAGRRLLDLQMRAEAAERRTEEMERYLKRAGFAVVEAESRLERALAEAKAERERAGEIQRSSSDTVERMRALLNVTEDRLRLAARAD